MKLIEKLTYAEEQLQIAALDEAAENSSDLTSYPATEPARSHKVDRNAPCPCGSGKKFKRCCGK